MRLIDMTFINVELGLSPKRYKVQGIINQLGFGETRIYRSYCETNQLDGLILLDPIDPQYMVGVHQDINLSAELSCYKSEHLTICPEVVLLHNIQNPLGTSKLAIFGMVDLYHNDEKISRDNVVKLFNILFTQYYRFFLQKQYGPAIIGKDMVITYNDTNIYKQIVFTKNNNTNCTIQEIQTIMTEISALPHNYPLYINYRDHHQLVPAGNYFSHEVHIAQNVNETLIKNILNNEIYSNINIRKNNLYPLNSDKYKYIDGTMVQRYASDKLYDELMQIIQLEYDLETIVVTIIQYILEKYSTVNIIPYIDKIINFYNQYFASLQLNNPLLRSRSYYPFCKFFYQKIMEANLNDVNLIRNIIEYIIQYKDTIFLDEQNFDRITNIMIDNNQRIDRSINRETFIQYFRQKFGELTRSANSILSKYEIDFGRFPNNIRLIFCSNSVEFYEMYKNDIKQIELENFDGLFPRFIDMIRQNPRLDRFITRIVNIIIGRTGEKITNNDIYLIYYKKQFINYLSSETHRTNYKELIGRHSRFVSYINMLHEVLELITGNLNANINLEKASEIINDYLITKGLNPLAQDKISSIFKLSGYNYELKYLKYKEKYLKLKNMTKK
jgi:hypothetical protein